MACNPASISQLKYCRSPPAASKSPGYALVPLVHSPHGSQGAPVQTRVLPCPSPPMGRWNPDLKPESSPRPAYFPLCVPLAHTLPRSLCSSLSGLPAVPGTPPCLPQDPCTHRSLLSFPGFSACPSPSHPSDHCFPPTLSKRSFLSTRIKLQPFALVFTYPHPPCLLSLLRKYHFITWYAFCTFLPQLEMMCVESCLFCSVPNPQVPKKGLLDEYVGILHRDVLKISSVLRVLFE